MDQTALRATKAPAAHEEFVRGQSRDAERHLPAPRTLSGVNHGLTRFFHFHAESVPDLEGCAINVKPRRRAEQVFNGILVRTFL